MEPKTATSENSVDDNLLIVTRFLQGLTLSVFVLLVTTLVVWKAVVIGYLWGWFVTPSLKIPVPAWHYIVGMLMIWDILRFKLDLRLKEDEAKYKEEQMRFAYERLKYGLLNPLFVLAVGFLWHYFAIGM